MKSIYSIGVDVGTSTTEIILSRLEIESSVGTSLLPVTEIGKKEVIYKSPIYFTPFSTKEQIDFTAIKKYVELALDKSSITKEEIQTGAVIITGETARKENAENVSRNLSEYLGEFVVATAGPKLESLLAGYGSFSCEVSRKEHNRIINLDIGGGTTNIVHFDSGAEQQTFALDIGGRLIKIDSEQNISYISERIESLLKDKRINLQIGDTANISVLREICRHLARSLKECIGIGEKSEQTKKLYITEICESLPFDAISFSGGVAEYINETKDTDNYFTHGDIGILLGEEITEEFKEFWHVVRESKEKIRATVIGAGSYSLSVSGSTIGAMSKQLPMKNIPIIKLDETDYESLFNNNNNKMNIYEDEIVALSMKGIRSPSYKLLVKIAEGVIQLFHKRKGPIIVLLEEDFAKALSQVIQRKIKKSSEGMNKDIICLDRIVFEHGEYIDIGAPLLSAVPVVIKTLIYQS